MKVIKSYIFNYSSQNSLIEFRKRNIAIMKALRILNSIAYNIYMGYGTNAKNSLYDELSEYSIDYSGIIDEIDLKIRR